MLRRATTWTARYSDRAATPLVWLVRDTPTREPARVDAGLRGEADEAAGQSSPARVVTTKIGVVQHLDQPVECVITHTAIMDQRYYVAVEPLSLRPRRELLDELARPEWGSPTRPGEPLRRAPAPMSSGWHRPSSIASRGGKVAVFGAADDQHRCPYAGQQRPLVGPARDHTLHRPRGRGDVDQRHHRPHVGHHVGTLPQRGRAQKRLEHGSDSAAVRFLPANEPPAAASRTRSSVADSHDRRCSSSAPLARFAADRSRRRFRRSCRPTNCRRSGPVRCRGRRGCRRHSARSRRS